MGRAARRLRAGTGLAAAIRAAATPGGPSVAERVACVPRLVRAAGAGRYSGASPARLASIAAAAAYVASPVDLVPELLLPVAGLADDAVVLAWAVKGFLEETDRFLAWERTQGEVLVGEFREGPSADAAADAVVPGDASPAPSRGPGRAAVDGAMEALRRRLDR